MNEYPNDETFPGIWIIAKYILERDIDRSFEFSVAQWLLEQNEEELAIKVRFKFFFVKNRIQNSDFRYLLLNIKMNQMMIHFLQIEFLLY